jgi:hypothetical protein
MDNIQNAMIMGEAASLALVKAGASEVVSSDVYSIVSQAYQTTDRDRRLCAQLVILHQLEAHRRLSDQERDDLKWLRAMLVGKWNYSAIENYARWGTCHCLG